MRRTISPGEGVESKESYEREMRIDGVCEVEDEDDDEEDDDEQEDADDEL